MTYNKSKSEFGAYVVAVTAVIMTFVSVESFAMPWSWDMFTQPSHKAQEEPALSRPEGTIPFNKRPIKLKDRSEAVSVVNPFNSTTESVERGKVKFTIYCAVCHGNGGKGDGTVGKKYVPPTDLTSKYIQDKMAGDIFYTITYGGLAIMPAYGDSVSEEDRWHIVNYIKDTFGTKKSNVSK
jgi:mono/diheme cytochrome c family protein